MYKIKKYVMGSIFLNIIVVVLLKIIKFSQNFLPFHIFSKFITACPYDSINDNVLLYKVDILDFNSIVDGLKIIPFLLPFNNPTIHTKHTFYIFFKRLLSLLGTRINYC